MIVRRLFVTREFPNEHFARAYSRERKTPRLDKDKREARAHSRVVLARINNRSNTEIEPAVVVLAAMFGAALLAVLVWAIGAL